jgi:hypothetical protein
MSAKEGSPARHGSDRDASSHDLHWPIVLGRFEDGELVSIRLVGEHVLTAGTMGRGKSGVLNAFMAELSVRTDVVLWGIDMKRGLELSPWRPALDRLATTEDAAHELLSAANRVLDARADLLADRHERKWQPSPAEPALVIAVDELAELDADAMALLERLARMGRAEGIIVIAVTQRPSADVLGGLDARTQMTVRIALGVVEPRDGELILGAGRLSAGWRADRLAGPGYFLVLAPGQHEQPRPARAYWLTDAAVTAAAGRSGADRAALDTVSAVAAAGPQEPSQTADWPGRADMEPHDSDPDAALLAALADAPRAGLSADELAERLGRGRTWVYKRLNALATAGRAVRLRRGPGRPGAARPDGTRRDREPPAGPSRERKNTATRNREATTNRTATARRCEARPVRSRAARARRLPAARGPRGHRGHGPDHDARAAARQSCWCFSRNFARASGRIMTRPPLPHRYPSSPSASHRRIVDGWTLATWAACTTVRSSGFGVRLDSFRILTYSYS